MLTTDFIKNYNKSKYKKQNGWQFNMYSLKDL